MKIKTLVALAALVLVGAAAAYSAPLPGKDNPTTSSTSPTATTNGKKPSAIGSSCEPQASVILTGTLAGDGSAPPSSLFVSVTGGNSLGKAYKKLTQPYSIGMMATTKVIRNGRPATAAALKQNDRVVVRGQTCKGNLSAGKTPALTIVRVTAHPAG